MIKLYKEIELQPGMLEFKATAQADKIQEEFRGLINEFISDTLSKDVDFIHLQVLLKDELDLLIAKNRINNFLQEVRK